MIDHIDSGMQSLGALAYTVGDTSGLDAGDIRSESPRALLAMGDQVHIDAVVEHSVPFHQAPPNFPLEQTAENANAQRAAVQPNLGGDFNLARDASALQQYENPAWANAQFVPTVEQSTGAILSMWA